MLILIMKISSDNVRYLAFEGGGGKGIVYLGALQALEDLEIVSRIETEKDDQKYIRLDSNKIKGIAGTSVGAITALLIACGYTSEEAKEILATDIGNSVLDTTEFGKMITIYSEENENCIVQDERFPDAEGYMNNAWVQYMQSDDKSFRKLLEVPLRSIRRFSFELFAYMVRGYLNFELKRADSKKHTERFHFIPLHEIIQSESQHVAADMILAEPLHSLGSMIYEFGFFLAAEARNLFDGFIEKKSGIKNCTFKQFHEEFNVDLVVTSVCLNSGEVFYFRNDEKWRNLCVADAVRMSMGIPFLFKPVMFEEENGETKPFSNRFENARFMVDGGIEDNFPIRVFNEPKADNLNPQVLGFALEPESKSKTTEIPSLVEYVDNALYIFLKNTTELQIKHPAEKDQVIGLDTGNVSIFDFNFAQMPKKIVENARKRTLHYFNEK